MLTRCVQRSNDQLEYLASLVIHTTTIADELVGPVPSNSEKALGPAPTQSMLYSLDSAQDRTQAALSELDNQLQRIRRAITGDDGVTASPFVGAGQSARASSRF